MSAKQYFASPALPSQEISDSGLSAEWVIATLLEHNAEFRALLETRKPTICEVSSSDVSQGKGFLSMIYRCEVKFEEGSIPPYSFIMKVPNLWHINDITTPEAGETKEETARRARNVLALGHNAECDCYEAFKGVRDFPIVKVWYTRKLDEDHSEPGVILMEDLSDQGTNPGMFLSTNIQQIRNVAKHLAAFHAQQLTGKINTSGLEGICYHKMPEFDDVRFRASFDRIRDLDPEWFGPLLKRFEPLTLTDVAKYVLFQRPVELGLPQVLLHGDLWTNNIIHKKTLDGTLPTEVLAFIDWQTVFHGNPMFDLARFVSFCADAEVRREAEDGYYIVQLYFDELFKQMSKTGCPLNIKVEQFIEAYKCCRVHQAMQLTSLAPLQMEHAHRDMQAGIREALLAKFVLRLKFLLRDADPLFDSALSTFQSAHH